MQYKTRTHKIHINKHKEIYAQQNRPIVTKPNSKNCKNCSSKCTGQCSMECKPRQGIPSTVVALDHEYNFKPESGLKLNITLKLLRLICKKIQSRC